MALRHRLWLRSRIAYGCDQGSLMAAIRDRLWLRSRIAYGRTQMDGRGWTDADGRSRMDDRGRMDMHLDNRTALLTPQGKLDWKVGFHQSPSSKCEKSSTPGPGFTFVLWTSSVCHAPLRQKSFSKTFDVTFLAHEDISIFHLAS